MKRTTQEVWRSYRHSVPRLSGRYVGLSSFLYCIVDNLFIVAFQKVVLRISASDRSVERFADDYLCPLMVTSELPASSLQLLPVDSAFASADQCEHSAVRYETEWRRRNGRHLLQVPLILQDDLDDSNVNNISLHCASRWKLPS